jgi:hypothetical protein
MSYSYDAATITILNWEKYNPRKDIKSTSWFRLQNSLFEDPNFFDFSPEELLLWIYLLSMASKKQDGQVRLSLAHAEKIGRLTLGIIESALEKLKSLGCVEVRLKQREEHVTLLSPAPHATDVTNEKNDTNITNVLDVAQTQTVMNFDFELIYNEYPRKEGKQEGFESCRARIRTRSDYDKLLMAVKNYRLRCDRHKVEKKYIRYFSNFITSGHWKDWIAPAPDISQIEYLTKNKINWSEVCLKTP